MRAAELNEQKVVVNFVEVTAFDEVKYIDPTGAVLGAVWGDGVFTAPDITPTLNEYTTAVQDKLDTEARTHNYDGILSACSYATSTNPRFSAEGQACVAWRDAVWAECYTILGLVQAGQRTPPTIPELLAALPVMTWPVV